jgi:hypothetical protein
VLTLSLLTGCRKSGAGEQGNSAAQHSTASEAQASQNAGEEESESQELILYDEDDFQDSVYAEEEEQPEGKRSLYSQRPSMNTAVTRRRMTLRCISIHSGNCRPISSLRRRHRNWAGQGDLWSPMFRENVLAAIISAITKGSCRRVSTGNVT